MTYTPIPAGTINWDVPLNAALADIDTRLTGTEISVADKVSKSGDTMTGTLTHDSASANDTAVLSQATGDVVARFRMQNSGRMEWGDGAAARDVSLARASAGQLRITPTVNASASSSAGGAFNVTNTASTGAGGVFYTEQGAPGGHLLVVRVNSGTFNQNGIFAQYNGTGHGVNISHSGTGANSSGLNVGSTNAAHSAVGISGVETAKGTIKVTHTGTGTDASASALSIDLAGTGTASQGIFMTGTNGGTTGNLMELRNGGTGPVFRVTSTGTIALGSGTGAPDVNLYRSAADVLKTDDKLITVVGLGVGNSEAATTPGTVTRKMEVFDASGTSLGFVPIYDAIT